MHSISVADPNPDPPDPHVFGPPGSGSGSFCHKARIVRKTLIFTVLLLLFDFLSLKNDVRVPSKSKYAEKLFFKISFLLASWRSIIKIEGSGSICQRHGSADPDPHQNVMDDGSATLHRREFWNKGTGSLEFNLFWKEITFIWQCRWFFNIFSTASLLKLHASLMPFLLRTLLILYTKITKNKWPTVFLTILINLPNNFKFGPT